MSSYKSFEIACFAVGIESLMRTEFKFHPSRRWRFDYYFELGGIKLAIEVEGGAWTGGRHTSGAGFIGDMEKYNIAAGMGITVMRFTPSQINAQPIAIAEIIKKHLQGEPVANEFADLYAFIKSKKTEKKQVKAQKSSKKPPETPF